MNNNLPQGWVECEFEKVCNIFTGNSINEKEKTQKYTNLLDGWNYIATKNISNEHEIEYENGIKIPFENKKFRIAPAYTTLLCIEGGSAGRKIAYTEEDVCFVNKLCAFVPYSTNILSKYIYYYLQSKKYLNRFNFNKSGLIGGVSISKLKAIKLELPSLNEQKRIVQKIEEEFEKIDEGIKKLKLAQEQIKQYKQSVLHREFNVYNKNLVTLEEVTTKINDGTHKTPKYEDSGIPFISVKDIRDKQIYFNDCKYVSEEEHKILYKRCNPEKGDVLITKSGTIGRTAIVKTDIIFDLFVSVALLKPKIENITSEFLMYALDNYISKIDIKQDVKGGVIKNLHIEDLKKIQINLPTLDEQEKIVKEIEKHFEIAENTEKIITQNLEKAQQLKQSILKKAFEGRLVPQDPNDEPASVLLEKIKNAHHSKK